MLHNQKVKLNVDQLLEKHKSALFRKFVEDNYDTVFTAIQYHKTKQLYTLKENNAAIDWIFYEESLIPVEE